MQNYKRRSTVHDLASLRLHPDGTKVVNLDTNLQLRKAKYATKDARGNWIAQDAGGLGRVKKRRVGEGKAQSDEEQEIDELGSSSLIMSKGEGNVTEEAGREQQESDAEHTVKDVRAKRRKAFEDDLDFIRSASGNSQVTRAPTTGFSTIDDGMSPDARPMPPQPSSDLLKCIHYFASTYYTEMGQLRDSSREHRKEKKRRKLQKMKSVPWSKAADLQKEASTCDDSGDDTSSGSSSSSEEDEANSRADGGKAKKPSRKGHSKRDGKQSVRRQTAYLNTDMYKVCDGSALMAIGMLMQQHVADLLSPRISDGWEEAMYAQGEKSLSQSGGRRRTSSRKRSIEEDEEEQAVVSGDGEDETEEDAVMNRIDDDSGDEDYIPE